MGHRPTALPLLLASAFALALAAVPRAQGPGPGYDSYPHSGRHDSLGGYDPAWTARERLGRLTQRLGYLSGRPGATRDQRALDLAERSRQLLASAQAELQSGRAREAMALILQAESLILELDRLTGDFGDRHRGPGPGPGTAPEISKDPLQPALGQQSLLAAYDLHKQVQDYLSRLRDRAPADAADGETLALLARIQDLLDKSKEALSAGKADASRELSLKAKSLLADLNLASSGRTGGSPDPGRLRLEERLRRASDQIRRRQADGAPADRLASASSLLDQARGSLSAGRAEAADAQIRQAESVLGSLPAGGAKASAAALDRLQGRIEKASGVVRASGSDKAARILEKAREHLAKAERHRAEGRTPRAEVEMDIALKLAAKAVDIARSSRR